MLRKGAIQQVKSEPGKFLSNLFLVNKKDLLQENNFLIRMDLQDAHFGIPLD